MRQYLVFSLTLLLVSLISLGNSAHAETSTVTIIASEGSVVDEDKPEKNFGSRSLIASGWTNSPDVEHVMQAQSYLKFDLGEQQTGIPSSSALETVEIEAAEFKVLIQTTWEEASRYIVTVNQCSDNSWSEDSIDWNNRACKNQSELRGLDSVLVNPEELPQLYSWDVTKSVREAIENNKEITFVITTRALTKPNVLEAELQNSTNFPPGLVWMWSDDRQQFGLSTAPRITVTYSATASQLYDDSEFLAVVIIPTLAVIVPFMLWMYQRTKNIVKT